MARPSTTLEVGDIAPEFRLFTVTGTSWRLSQNLPVALYFGRGTFCPQCRKQLVQLQRYYPLYRQVGVQVAMVLGQSFSKTAAYLEKNPFSFPLLPDEERRVIKEYGVYHRLGLAAYNLSRPAVFLIDFGRQIQYIHVGSSPFDIPPQDFLLVEASKLTDRR